MYSLESHKFCVKSALMLNLVPFTNLLNINSCQYYKCCVSDEQFKICPYLQLSYGFVRISVVFSLATCFIGVWSQHQPQRVNLISPTIPFSCDFLGRGINPSLLRSFLNRNAMKSQSLFPLDMLKRQLYLLAPSSNHEGSQPEDKVNTPGIAEKRSKVPGLWWCY